MAEQIQSRESNELLGADTFAVIREERKLQKMRKTEQKHRDNRGGLEVGSVSGLELKGFLRGWKVTAYQVNSPQVQSELICKTVQLDGEKLFLQLQLCLNVTWWTSHV